jgi:hypothetical protein
MKKKILKVILILIMIVGITVSFVNPSPKKADAVMIDQLLEFFDLGPAGYAYRCFSTGNGCHTVIPDN